MEIIAAALASGLVQYLKTQLRTNQWATLGILALVALILSALYTYLVSAGYWMTVYKVVVEAGAIYTFIIQRFES